MKFKPTVLAGTLALVAPSARAHRPRLWPSLGGDRTGAVFQAVVIRHIPKLSRRLREAGLPHQPRVGRHLDRGSIAAYRYATNMGGRFGVANERLCGYGVRLEPAGGR